MRASLYPCQVLNLEGYLYSSLQSYLWDHIMETESEAGGRPS